MKSPVRSLIVRVLSILLLPLSGIAQTDISCEILYPTSASMHQLGMDFNVFVEINNLGASSIASSDSIFIDVSLNGNIVTTEFKTPSNFTSGASDTLTIMVPFSSLSMGLHNLCATARFGNTSTLNEPNTANNNDCVPFGLGSPNVSITDYTFINPSLTSGSSISPGTVFSLATITFKNTGLVTLNNTIPAFFVSAGDTLTTTYNLTVPLLPDSSVTITSAVFFVTQAPSTNGSVSYCFSTNLPFDSNPSDDIYCNIFQVQSGLFPTTFNNDISCDSILSPLNGSIYQSGQDFPISYVRSNSGINDIPASDTVAMQFFLDNSFIGQVFRTPSIFTSGTSDTAGVIFPFAGLSTGTYEVCVVSQFSTGSTAFDINNSNDTACTTVNLQDPDISLTSFIATIPVMNAGDTLATGATIDEMSVTLKNTGLATIVNDIPFVVYIGTDSVTLIAPVTSALQPNDSITLTIPGSLLPILPTAQGPFTLCGYTDLLNDTDPTNDEICNTYIRQIVPPNYDIAADTILRPIDGSLNQIGVDFDLFWAYSNTGLLDIPASDTIYSDIYLDGVLIGSPFRTPSTFNAGSTDTVLILFPFASLTSGTYDLCIVKRFGITSSLVDGNSSNDTTCTSFTISDPDAALIGFDAVIPALAVGDTLATGATIDEMLVTVYNNGVSDIYEVPLIVTAGGVSDTLFATLNAPLTPGDTTTLTLPGTLIPTLPSAPGPFTICADLFLSFDTDPTNDEICNTYIRELDSYDIAMVQFNAPLDNSSVQQGVDFDLDFDIENLSSVNIPSNDSIGLFLFLNNNNLGGFLRNLSVFDANSTENIALPFAFSNLSVGNNEICVGIDFVSQNVLDSDLSNNFLCTNFEIVAPDVAVTNIQSTDPLLQNSGDTLFSNETITELNVTIENQGLVDIVTEIPLEITTNLGSTQINVQLTQPLTVGSSLTVTINSGDIPTIPTASGLFDLCATASLAFDNATANNSTCVSYFRSEDIGGSTLDDLTLGNVSISDPQIAENDTFYIGSVVNAVEIEILNSGAVDIADTITIDLTIGNSTTSVQHSPANSILAGQAYTFTVNASDGLPAFPEDEGSFELCANLTRIDDLMANNDLCASYYAGAPLSIYSKELGLLKAYYSQGYLNIEPKDFNQNQVTLQVHSILGIEILNKTIQLNNSPIRVPLENIATGVYILQMGDLSTKFVVK